MSSNTPTRTGPNNVPSSPSLFGSVKKRVLELSQTSTPNRDLERQFWMPDSRAKQCYDCGVTFTTFRRRHHCRICGQVFCHACSLHMIDAKVYKTLTGTDSNGPVRSCRYCFKATMKNDSSASNFGAFSNANSGSQASSSNSSMASSSNRSEVPRKLSLAPVSSQHLSRGRDFVLNDDNLTPTRMRRDSSSWLGFGSNLARRFSSTASLGSFINPLSTPQERRSRPQSSNSERFTVLDLDDENIENNDNIGGRRDSAGGIVSSATAFQRRHRSRQNTGELQNSSSFDNLYSLMNRRMDSKFDENKPKWVKELLEQSKFEEDELSYHDVNEGGNENRKTTLKESDEREEMDDESAYLDSSDLLDTSKTSNESLLEIKSPEDGVVSFRKQTQSPHENRKSKLRKIFGETIDSREFQPTDFGEQNEADFFVRETMKQYFADELSETPSTSLPVSDQSDSENVSGTPLPVSLSDEEIILKMMSLIYDQHLRKALEQMLTDQKLSLDWLPVIHDISGRIANTITLSHHAYLGNVDNYFFGLEGDQNNPKASRNARNLSSIIGYKYFSSMDIRQRVKIKCIPGDVPKHESTIVQGLVFTKNVANRRMKTRIENAKVLLFACSIGYDERKRTLENGKLTCMDLMRLQEANYGESLCTRIGALSPDIIFVQGSISGSILERLLEFFNITVVLNVKRSVMERLALFTGTQLIISPEIINLSKLGRCSRFSVMDCTISLGKTKSLMIVETDVSNLGCSVLLKGTERYEEFVKVKNILLESIYCHYNARCEQAFNLALNCLPLDVKTLPSQDAQRSLSEIYKQLQLKADKPDSDKSSSEAVEDSVFDIETTSPVASQLTAVMDDSDPLRSQEYSFDKRNDIDISDDNQEANLVISNLSNTISSKLQEILDNVLLSASPNVQFPLPFLVEKDIYFRSCLRPYFALNLVKSQKLSTALEQNASVDGFEESFSNENSKKSNQSEEEDIDYVNFNYLSWITAEKCSKYPQLKDIILSKAELKLTLLRSILRQRYMIQKAHPLLYGEGVPLSKMERFSAPDFRACGPYLRCIPDIVAANHFRNVESDQNEEQILSEPLSIGRHQEISVLFSMFSPKSKNAPNYCFKPRIIDIQFYGRYDMSLGFFLFRHFFFMRTRHTSSAELNAGNGTNNELPEVFRKALCMNENCLESLFRHVMRFAHHRGTLTILMNRVQESQNQQTFSKKILTWNYCKQCQKSSKITELGSDALALSFGKFLELKFYSKDALNLTGFDGEQNNCQCKHSIRREAYQFFNFDQLVVTFKYDPIVIYEVATPPPLISISRKQFTSKKILADVLQDHTLRGHEFFSRLEGEIERIHNLIQNWGQSSSGITSSQSSSLLEQFSFDIPQDCGVLEEYLSFVREERSRFVESLKEVHVKISEISMEKSSLIEFYRTQNIILKIKRFVMELWSNWNEKISEFLLNHKKIQDKSFNRVLKSILPGSGEPKNSDNLLLLEGGEENKINDKLSTSNSDLSTDLKVEEAKTQWPRSATVSAGTSGKLGAITSRVISKVTNKVTLQTESDAKSQVSELFTFLPNPFEGSVSGTNSSNLKSSANGQTERFLLPSSADLTVVVKDKDLGSIIAYSLKTQEYEQKLTKLLEDSIDGGTFSKTIEEPLEEINPHIGIDFQDGNAKFYCSIHFAAEFARLRSLLVTDGGWSHRETVRNVFAGFSPINTTTIPKDTCTNSTVADTQTLPIFNKEAEELYIHSLANCIPWNAIGGKSGSTFSKTTNQRFILKEISKGELKHFLTFARDYVKYCGDCLNTKRPSTFVKIVGCYELAVSDSIHNILVMENLFYECNISFIYDLKGSMRNRKVEIASNRLDKDAGNGDAALLSESADKTDNAGTSSEGDFQQTTTVLMDENLRQISTLHPLYVHVHSKRLLLEALGNDSDFLKSKGIMDYSLLVGFDKQYSEYVVGIIDYVRLYDFTKEIEFRVKKLGKTIDPTIVRPSHYQKRFLEAIQEYFIEVPDKWLNQLSSGTVNEPEDDTFQNSIAKPPPLEDDVISYATLRQFDT